MRRKSSWGELLQQEHSLFTPLRAAAVDGWCHLIIWLCLCLTLASTDIPSYPSFRPLQEFFPTSWKRIFPLSESHSLETHIYLLIMVYLSQGGSAIQSYQDSVLPVVAYGFAAFLVNPCRASHQICIIPWNICWETLTNVPDYCITLIPASCRQEQEAEQNKKASLQWGSTDTIVPVCRGIQQQSVGNPLPKASPANSEAWCRQSNGKSNPHGKLSIQDLLGSCVLSLHLERNLMGRNMSCRRITVCIKATFVA